MVLKIEFLEYNMDGAAMVMVFIGVHAMCMMKCFNLIVLVLHGRSFRQNTIQCLLYYLPCFFTEHCGFV